MADIGERDKGDVFFPVDLPDVVGGRDLLLSTSAEVSWSVIYAGPVRGAASMCKSVKTMWRSWGSSAALVLYFMSW